MSRCDSYADECILPVESIWHSHRREIAFFKHNETTQIKKLPLSKPSPPPHLTKNPTISVESE